MSKMNEIQSMNNIILNGTNLRLNLNEGINSDNSSINEEVKRIKDNNKSVIIQNKTDIFGDLTSIIKSKIKQKNLLVNNKRKINSSLLNYTVSKKKEKKQYNINIKTFTNTTKENSEISSYSNKIKNNKKINPEIFVNKRTRNKINVDKVIIKKKASKDNKKFNINLLLTRFEEEQKKTSKKLEAKKQEIKEQEKKIYTGKPFIEKIKLKSYEKYSKDFLIRQKELNQDSIIKKNKLIEEIRKKKEQEYQIIQSNNIINKDKKKHLRNKSSDEWVDRLYNKDLKKRKMNQYILETVFIPNFKPDIEKKNVKSVLNKNKRTINKVLKEYKEKTNPDIIINYLNDNNIFEEKNKLLFRTKIFGKSYYRYSGKMNKSME